MAESVFDEIMRRVREKKAAEAAETDTSRLCAPRPGLEQSEEQLARETLPQQPEGIAREIARRHFARGYDNGRGR